jgi:hypothetical protein
MEMPRVYQERKEEMVAQRLVERNSNLELLEQRGMQRASNRRLMHIHLDALN